MVTCIVKCVLMNFNKCYVMGMVSDRVGGSKRTITNSFGLYVTPITCHPFYITAR